MTISTYAKKFPDKAAVIMAGSGEQVTFKELDQRSQQIARLWRENGLKAGDHVAVFMENNCYYHAVVWAALRSALYITPVNRYLTAEEAAYVVDDCGARSLVTSSVMGEVANELRQLTPKCETYYMVGDPAEGYQSFEAAIATQDPHPLDEEKWGMIMFYSSGTTGRPKGIFRPAPDSSFDSPGFLFGGFAILYRFDETSTYLSPAPLYHSAPLGFSTSVLGVGGTVIVLEKFDPILALESIEKYQVTHSQWVPTMFTRMLKMPEEERNRFDLSSQEVAIHAAAPCPVEVKRQMIDWWGPVIYEYWGATEGTGKTMITSEEWLERPGSVGKAVLGTLHICDDEGNELPSGEIGVLYADLPAMPFEYFGDPAKTKTAVNPEHPSWATVGDMGYLDEEGYLYLTDRKSFMIISGGVNIYPQEIENAMIMHPKVGDIAVFGVPNEEFGEEVKAVVQPAEGIAPDEDLTKELMNFAREHIAHYKCPRSIDFIEEMPRLPTGKLYKRKLRDQYWGEGKSRIL